MWGNVIKVPSSSFNPLLKYFLKPSANDIYRLLSNSEKNARIREKTSGSKNLLKFDKSKMAKQ